MASSEALLNAKPKRGLFQAIVEGFKGPPLPRCEDEKWEKMSYRERTGYYFHIVSAANFTIPVFLVVVLYAFVGLVWWALFYFLVRAPTEAIFSELNVRKFILYNVFHGVIGLGATCGPLGTKNGTPFLACGLTFLTPGTLCSPLFPGLIGYLQKIPCQRSVLAVLAYAVYLAMLVVAIRQPSAANVHMVVAAGFVGTIFDATIFFASRGEHYGYMVVCMCFSDWVAGCQWVQFMLWIMVGISKCGPWFKYVVQVLAKESIWTPFLPENFSAKVLNKNWPQDFTPSQLTVYLAHMAAACEFLFPVLCTTAPGSITNLIGVCGMIGFHGFIWSTLPTASVFEWQYFSMFMTYFLYHSNEFSLPTSPVLIIFLLVVLLVLPVIGRLEPCLVPFLMAYRQYAGNWRLGTWVIRKTARPKLEKIKTYNSIFWWEQAPPEVGGDHAEYQLLSSFVVAPQFRGMFSVWEKFEADNNAIDKDFYFVNSFTFTNAVLGWDLAVGWLTFRECFRTALVEMCGLEVGDMYFIQCEPVKNVAPYMLSYRMIDICKGPLDAEVYANIPYGDLEGTHPMEVYLKPEALKKGKSIRGTFLSTYY